MNARKMFKQAEKILGDNSPQILTAIGVAGTITTAIFAGRASFIAAGVLAEEDERRFRESGPTSSQEDREITPREKFDLLWKLYIPAVGVGSTTVACIILSNRIGSRRTAAVAAAYTVAEKGFHEYKDKVVEKIGENEERKIRDELAQERVDRYKGPEVVIVSDSGKVMCHDAFSNQFFYSDMESLRKAQNDVNAQILHSDYATISDFYHYINGESKNTGLETTSISSEMGWNTDRTLELDFTTVMYKDKTPCISINFTTVPIRDPHRFC